MFKDTRIAAVIVLTAANMLLGPSTSFAGPKETCQQIVSGLGYDVVPYRFEEGGIFTRDQHIFGELTCYVDADGSFNSLYRRDTPVAEDGFFGFQALEERDRALSTAEAETDAAARKLAAKVGAAQAEYDAAAAQIAARLSEQLTAVRAKSDPRSAAPNQASKPAPTVSPVASQSTDAPVAADAVQSVQTLASGKNPQGTKMWVTSERLNIRSCPSEKCGRTGWATQGDSFVILEENNGWGRIDEPVRVGCENGTTFMIDDGDTRCVAENGIVDGMMSRWVSMNFLVSAEPTPAPDPIACDSGFLASSDNYATYANAFCVAARKLIQEGECTEAEIKDFGGWGSSPQYGQGTFFIYCGGMNLSNKIYLNAKTGKIFRE